MNLTEVKHQFPEAIAEIEALENLGFAHRSAHWIDTLKLEQAQTACWLIGKIGTDRDAHTLITLLSSQRSELWMQAATSLSPIATSQHLPPLISILATSTHPAQRNSIVYALSFLSNLEGNEPGNEQIVRTLIQIATNPLEPAFVSAQALEGLGNQLSKKSPKDLFRQAVSAIIQSLDHSEAEIRFWACFAVGAIARQPSRETAQQIAQQTAQQTARTITLKQALPKLQSLAQNDRTIVPGWWSVGEEAEDAIARINGQEPPLRQALIIPE